MCVCEECLFYSECCGVELCNTFIAEEDILIQCEEDEIARDEYVEYSKAYWDYISDGM